MSKRTLQQDFFKSRKAHGKRPDKFGGAKRTTRASRKARPISTTKSMHLVLKSLKAVGAWSFLTPANKKLIKELLTKYASYFGVQILSYANVGNHLHIHLKARSHLGFKSFVRAFTGTLALKITGASKINKLKEKFWTQVPYTRFVHGLIDHLRLKDYFEINEIEGFGLPRAKAEYFVETQARTREWFRKRLIELG